MVIEKLPVALKTYFFENKQPFKKAWSRILLSLNSLNTVSLDLLIIFMIVTLEHTEAGTGGAF